MIQPVFITHAPLLAALHAESFGEECWTQDQIKGSLMLASTQGWLFMLDGHLAGFILLQAGEQEWEILTFAVRPALRRQGIGEQLLTWSIQKATNAGAAVFLEVAADNDAARHLYEKLGFNLLTTRKNYYVRRDRTIDALCYRYTPEAPPIAPVPRV